MRAGANDPSAIRFSWRLAASLAPLGLVFAALTITGSIRGVDATKWAALGILALVGTVAGLCARSAPFRHGLLAGFLVGLVAIWMQALFIDTYFANNPGYEGIEMPFGWTARQATFVLGPINALLAGLVAGAFAWPIAKGRQRLAPRSELAGDCRGRAAPAKLRR